MMSSLRSSDGRTHLKIAFVAALASAVFTAVGLHAGGGEANNSGVWIAKPEVHGKAIYSANNHSTL